MKLDRSNRGKTVVVTGELDLDNFYIQFSASLQFYYYNRHCSPNSSMPGFEYKKDPTRMVNKTHIAKRLKNKIKKKKVIMSVFLRL